MNKTEVLDLIRTLGDQAFPQLVTYARIDLIENVAVVALFYVLHALLWIFRKRIVGDSLKHGDESQFAMWIGLLIVTGGAIFFGTFFVASQTARVLLTPELEAIRLIVGK